MSFTLKTIKWFETVGAPLDTVDISLSIATQVSNWDEAISYCSQQCWEDTTLFASNALTLHLNSVCKNEFQGWNAIVESVKATIASDLSYVRNYVADRKLNPVVVDCVEWDILGAGATEHYSEFCPPSFFTDLLEVYRVGHFPCGWVGEWPSGGLVVF